LDADVFRENLERNLAARRMFGAFCDLYNAAPQQH
jgi:hypothetical protein